MEILTPEDLPAIKSALDTNNKFQQTAVEYASVIDLTGKIGIVKYAQYRHIHALKDGVLEVVDTVRQDDNFEVVFIRPDGKIVGLGDKYELFDDGMLCAFCDAQVNPGELDSEAACKGCQEVE